jgi:hypothetical protein
MRSFLFLLGCDSGGNSEKRIDIKGEMDIINNNSNHYYLRGAL